MIDTMARAIAGADENDAGEMSKAIERAELSKTGTGTILLVHHAGWSGERGRGSTAIPSAQDNVVNCFPAKDSAERPFDGKGGRPLVIEVTSYKLKDGSPAPATYFRCQEHRLGTLDDGTPWTSVALVETSKPTAEQVNHGSVLDLLREHGDLSRTQIQELLGWGKSKACVAVAAAVDLGQIVMVTKGRSTVYRPSALKRPGSGRTDGPVFPGARG